jgi:hypothetical protein
VKYLLLIYNNPAHIATADYGALIQGHRAVCQDLIAAGALVSSAALTAPPEAATVRVHDGVPAVTDGPFLESKEYLAGYYLVDCETREQAYEIAARIPCGSAGAVEVRPIDEQVTAVVRGEA